jgi:hypothetical protein
MTFLKIKKTIIAGTLCFSYFILSIYLIDQNKIFNEYISNLDKARFLGQDKLRTSLPKYLYSLHIDDLNGAAYGANGSWEEIKSTYSWCTGNGSKMNPYIIREVYIINKGSKGFISINNSNAYFELEGCKIYNNSDGNLLKGGMYSRM